MKIIKAKILMKNRIKSQESKWKYKVAFFTVTGFEISHHKQQIVVSFPEFVCENCVLAG